MKIAMLKIGSRVAENMTGIAAGEALSLYNILAKADPTNEVCIFTQVLNKDKNETIVVKDIEEHFNEINDYDVLVVVNGNAAFFGGGESISDCLSYKAINLFPRKIFYFLCDPAITLKQINVKSKAWGEKYADANYLTIDKTKLNYVCQAYNLNEIKRSITKGCVPAESFVRFPFDKFPMFTAENKCLPYNPTPEYDISYGGTFRSGRREADMLKYFFGHAEDIKMEVFGKIKEDDFKKAPPARISRPIWNGPVDYSEFNAKMNNSLSTIIIGDPVYIKSEDIAQRVYESILAGCVVFVDRGYDVKKHIYTDPELQAFCYVRTVKELDEKVRRLKEDEDFRKHILELQYNDTKVDLEQYKKDMMEILRS